MFSEIIEKYTLSQKWNCSQHSVEWGIPKKKENVSHHWVCSQNISMKN